jgi:hypothetical protein
MVSILRQINAVPNFPPYFPKICSDVMYNKPNQTYINKFNELSYELDEMVTSI